MELNREQIKNALGHCYAEATCSECPYQKTCFEVSQWQILKDALSLITQQETEYNELYELCESYRIERDAIRGAAYSYKLYVKTLEKENETLKTLLDESYDTQNSLTEENERLKLDVEVCGAELSRYTENIVQMAKQDRADTVRKMQERLKAKAKANEWNGTICGEDIDQIAKEMLDDGQ